MEKKLGAALVALGVIIVASQVFADWPWQGGILLGLVLAVAGGLLLREERPRLEAPGPPGPVRPWRFEAVVPMSDRYAGTLRELLEDEVLGLELEADGEHEAVLVRFRVAASGRDVADRIGRRVLERHGLILEESRAVRP